MTGTPPFSRGILQLPDTDDHQYITVQNAPDVASSEAQILVYGHTILVSDAGILSASFYAEEADTAGVWYLVWEPKKNEAGNLERCFSAQSKASVETDHVVEVYFRVGFSLL